MKSRGTRGRSAVAPQLLSKPAKKVPRIGSFRYRGTREPNSPANLLGERVRRLDDPEKPENQDQDQQTAKTNVHGIPPVFTLLEKRRAAHHRSRHFGNVIARRGIILPVWKTRHLLDFSAFRRE